MAVCLLFCFFTRADTQHTHSHTHTFSLPLFPFHIHPVFRTLSHFSTLIMPSLSLFLPLSTLLGLTVTKVSITFRILDLREPSRNGKVRRTRKKLADLSRKSIPLDNGFQITRREITEREQRLIPGREFANNTGSQSNGKTRKRETSGISENRQGHGYTRRYNEDKDSLTSSSRRGFVADRRERETTVVQGENRA